MVEFDGPTHLSDEQVSKDKICDQWCKAMVALYSETKRRTSQVKELQINRESLTAMLEVK